MAQRTCSTCQSEFDSPNLGRGKWQRYCSPECGAQRPSPSRPTCQADGCERPARSLSAIHCEAHYFRLRRTGSLTLTPRPEPTALPTGPRVYATGPAHPSWKGDAITFSGAHMRIRAHLGPARDRECTDCGGRAAHWSYDHRDADELSSSDGPYSTKPEHYEPRCVPCHKRFDLREGALP